MSDFVVSHMAQALPKIVRVIPDADRVYSDDPRWTDVTKEERHIAFQVINRIQGQEFIVARAEWFDGHLFYHLVIRPKLRINDVFGVPMDIGYAFVPYEYVTVIKQGFMEAT